MGQIVAMVIIPPLVGIATYAILRFIWSRQDKADSIVRSREI
ncbi:MAG TPA: hypothetical protein VFW22_11370 [Pseudolabrys sp.]|nr:hypothetical protein [Pseudolabrys sp.]